MTDAITRQEKLLAGVSIKPITREEMFLAKLAGQNVNTPEPITRKEKLMQRIIDNGISGGGDENFVGVKLSDFTGGTYGLPQKADISFLTEVLKRFPESHPPTEQNLTANMFKNNNNNANSGGLYARLKEVKVCDRLRHFGISMFENCTELENIVGDTSEIIQISNTAFSTCTKLVNFPYLPKLCYLGSNAFKGCTGLSEFKFYLHPKDSTQTFTVMSNAFTNCTNLLDIYVPWSEGEVENAPWGATNATIHYNTTYDENHEPIV